MRKAIILFAHGSRDPAWAEPFERLRDSVKALAPGIDVEIAFLEMMHPNLAATVEALVSLGVQSIAVVPAFMAQGGHLKRDLPLLVEQVRQQYPGLTITLQPTLGEAQPVIDAMARHIAANIQ
jgi:sirohydrochlorin cobaltochelatase